MEKLLASHTTKDGNKISLEEWKSPQGVTFWRIAWESANGGSRSSVPYDDSTQASATYNNTLRYP